MEYRKLGNSGLKVSEIGLGANTFGWRIDEQSSVQVIHSALEQGINYIDTADIYDRGRSEEFVGKGLKNRRHDVILATKFGRTMGEGPNFRGGSRQYLMRAVEASLKRLQTDYIDLYQMHEPDPNTPIEETLRALDDIIKEGKVRYIGTSNFKAWQICEALFLSRDCYLHSFITEQPYYNILKREIEGELVPFCRSYHIGIIPWGPLAGGFLTGKYQAGGQPSADWRFPKHNYLYGNMLTESNFSTLVKLIEFAEQRGHTVGELAIAWLLAKSWVSTVIVGVRTVEQLLQNLAGTSWKLSAEDIAELDKISQVNDK